MPPETDRPQVRPIILPYDELPTACHDYDPGAPFVAVRVAAAINEFLPDVTVEHVGSTSVPGCAGKGVVDLMLLYNQGQLEKAKGLLAALGFQPQCTRDPFPKSRPMRIGAINHNDTVFRLHVHVIVVDSPEVGELRMFRDRLRADSRLVADYVARKRRIVAAGVTDSIDYSIEKGSFIQAEPGLRKSEF